MTTTVQCPGCRHQQPAEVKNIYSQCDLCGTITAIAPIEDLIETENDGPDIRNTEETNQLRLGRAFKAYGDIPLEVLDFGCGTGALLALAKKHSGCRVLGIDKDTTQFFPYLAAESFDVIFMVESIEHLARPALYLTLMDALLTPGGVIYIETTFAESIPDFLNHPYVDPKIGHRTILSKEALYGLCENRFDITEVNANVMILKKL